MGANSKNINEDTQRWNAAWNGIISNRLNSWVAHHDTLRWSDMEARHMTWWKELVRKRWGRRELQEWEEMESGFIGRRLSCRRWKGRRRRGRLSATAGSPWPRSGRGEVFLISSEFLQQEIVFNFKKLFFTSSSIRGLSPCCPIVWLGQALVDWGLEGEDITFLVF